MTIQVVVLGAGYAGAGAVRRLRSELGGRSGSVRVVWVSEDDYHFVLHEGHRIVRDPEVAEDITVPVGEITGGEVEFVEARVEGVDTDARRVELSAGAADIDDVEYDYLLIAVGSRTAFYGIPGLEAHAHTLKSREDAEAIHEDLDSAARAATPGDPARVVVGGAGLSGIQTAGEVAEFRDDRDRPVEIHLVEALDEIFPGQDDAVQTALARRLRDCGVEIRTGDPITEATADEIRFDSGDRLGYDVFVWTGGVTGRECMASADVDCEERSNRVHADRNFRTSDPRVFAIGDAALVDQGEKPAPPTAQAAWQAAEVAAENVLRAVDDRPLKTWTYDDKGTLVSVGDRAVAHDVDFSPVDTFGSYPAVFLKKFVAARWIADMSSWRRALSAWSSL